jgi:hypothetical protein
MAAAPMVVTPAMVGRQVAAATGYFDGPAGARGALGRLGVRRAGRR